METNVKKKNVIYNRVAEALFHKRMQMVNPVGATAKELVWISSNEELLAVTG